MADGSTRAGTLTDDDMTFDPEGAAASAAVASRFADPIAPLPERTARSVAAPRLPMPGVAGGRQMSASPFGAGAPSACGVQRTPSQGHSRIEHAYAAGLLVAAAAQAR